MDACNPMIVSTAPDMKRIDQAHLEYLLSDVLAWAKPGIDVKLENHKNALWIF